MRYTKKYNDGGPSYGRSPMQIEQQSQPNFFYGQQPQQMTPTINVQDTAGHTYQVGMDISVPNLNLTPEMVEDFQTIENFVDDSANNATQDTLQKNLKHFVLMKAVGMPERLLTSFRRKTKIPISHNGVWDKLCELYQREYLNQFSIGRNTQFQYWLPSVLYRYGTHHYPDVSDKAKNAIVTYYLSKCHMESMKSNPTFTEQASYLTATGFDREDISDQIGSFTKLNNLNLRGNPNASKYLVKMFQEDGRKRSKRKSGRKSKRKSGRKSKRKSKKSKRKSRSRSRSRKLKKLENELEEMLMHAKKKSKRKPSKKRKRRST